MSSTEQQLTSALDTYFSKLNKTKQSKKIVVFSSLPLNRQSIYILSQTSQVGRMECSGQQLSDTCVQCYDCADTHSYERCRWETGLILVEQSLSYVCTSVQFSDIKAPPVLSLRFSSEPRLLARPFNVLSSCIHGKHLLISPGVQREFSFWFLCFTHCETC